MNLHALVRPAIKSVNPDTLLDWMQSSGYTTADDGHRSPTFNKFSDVAMQVQGLNTKDLQHVEKLNLQSELRKIYSYGNIQGVVRPSLQGGDLFVFPQQIGGTPQVWLLVQPMETWTDAQGQGWSSGIVCLQLDIVNNTIDISSGVVTLDNGQITGDMG